MFFVALLEYFRGDIMENNSKKKTNRIKKSLNISLSENDKKYIDFSLNLKGKIEAIKSEKKKQKI